MRGKFYVEVKRRITNPKTKMKKDLHDVVGKYYFYNWIDGMNRKSFCIYEILGYTISMKNKKPIFSPRKYTISRDELAFIRFIHLKHGGGDYIIMTRGKGKERGTRPLWDGLITDRDFLRRTDATMRNLISDKSTSYYDRETYSTNSKQYVSRYFRTKRPGKWYNLN